MRQTRYEETEWVWEDGYLPSDPAVIGGYSHPDQSLPSGRGKYRFVSFETNLTDTFEMCGADDLLDRIFTVFGPVNIVRTDEDSWSVETTTEICGEISTVFDRLDNVKSYSKFDDVFVSKNGQLQKVATYGDLR